MADFTIAVNLVLKQEGGYVNDPADPGGETNWGISKRAYPNLTIGTLTADDAKQIYRRDYWEFDNVTRQRLANLLLSLSVNIGKSKAIVLLQRALCVTQDGVWGPLTEHLANTNPNVLVNFAVVALVDYQQLTWINPRFQKYLHGWFRRVCECLAG